MTKSSLKQRSGVLWCGVCSNFDKIYLFLCIVVNVTCMISHFQDGGSLS